MLVLTTTTYNGAPSEHLSAAFDEIGGTIGRADHNHMVLPDPERTVSRVHAHIGFRDGCFVVEDRGSNPISVNGREIGVGGEAALRPGDLVQIGAYVLAVGAGVAAGPDDLFADTGASAHRISPTEGWPATSSPAPFKSSSHAPPPTTADALPDPLLAALLESMRLDATELQHDALTPDLMRRIGQLLRETAQDAFMDLLGRFDPARLEAMLVSDSDQNGAAALDRPARLWEVLQTLHSRLTREADHEFRQAFDAAFRRASEMQRKQARDTAEPQR